MENPMLVVFRCKVAATFYMLGENAESVLAAIGKPMAPRGIITVDQLPAAITALQLAADQSSPPADPPDEEIVSPIVREVGFAQRAFPLLEMMRAALKKKADVTWGV
jgi:hypothetical protein